MVKQIIKIFSLILVLLILAQTSFIKEIGKIIYPTNPQQGVMILGVFLLVGGVFLWKKDVKNNLKGWKVRKKNKPKELQEGW